MPVFKVPAMQVWNGRDIHNNTKGQKMKEAEHTQNPPRKRYPRCIGVKKELIDAVRRSRNEAEQGNAEAQYFIGCCYEYGDGVVKDKAEAVKWYRMAAEQGNAKAQGLLEVIKQDRNTIS